MRMGSEIPSLPIAVALSLPFELYDKVYRLVYQECLDEIKRGRKTCRVCSSKRGKYWYSIRFTACDECFDVLTDYVDENYVYVDDMDDRTEIRQLVDGARFDRLRIHRTTRPFFLEDRFFGQVITGTPLILNYGPLDH